MDCVRNQHTIFWSQTHFWLESNSIIVKKTFANTHLIVALELKEHAT